VLEPSSSAWFLRYLFGMEARTTRGHVNLGVTLEFLCGGIAGLVVLLHGRSSGLNGINVTVFIL
jgi:hypothetical protein